MKTTNRVSFIYFGKDQHDFVKTCIHEMEKRTNSCVLSLSSRSYMIDVTFSTNLGHSEFKKELSLLFQKKNVNDILYVETESERDAFMKGFLCGWKHNCNTNLL